MERKPSRNLSPSEYEEAEFLDEWDIENQSPSSRPQPVLIEIRGRKMNCHNVHQILYQAAMKDDWRIAESILKKHPSFLCQKISDRGETVLHIAAQASSTRFVLELVNLMERGHLELLNNDGSSAFFYAAASGIVEIAKAMREKNENLPNIPGEDGLLPISVAAIMAKKDMISYLCEVTSLDKLQRHEHVELLEYTVKNKLYDVALKLFRRDRTIASDLLEGNGGVLYTLATRSLSLSNKSQEGNWGRFTTGVCSPAWGIIRSAFSIAAMQFVQWFKGVEVLRTKSLLKKQAGLLLEEIWEEYQSSMEDDLLKEKLKERSFLHTAAKAGNVEFLTVCLRNHPDLMWNVDRFYRTIFHVAVLHRQEKIFNLIYQIGAVKDLITFNVDIDGNNILHLAGMLGRPIRKKFGEIGVLKDSLVEPMYYTSDNAASVESLQLLLQQTKVIKQITEMICLKDEEKIMPQAFLRIPGAAIQMQREILWYKAVEKIVPPSLSKMKNGDGKTPRELYIEDHRQLFKEGERWMKDTASSCMIVATLIATMVFAAGFTVPGGNNSDVGTPVMLKLKGFTVFVISDAVALFSSIASIIMFLSILTARYAENDFIVSLPTKLLFGLTTLFVSIVGMLVAFAATFFLVYNHHMAWEPKLIAAFAAASVALFGCLHYKQWFDVAKSTYSSKFLFKPGKHSLY